MGLEHTHLGGEHINWVHNNTLQRSSETSEQAWNAMADENICQEQGKDCSLNRTNIHWMPTVLRWSYSLWYLFIYFFGDILGGILIQLGIFWYVPKKGSNGVTRLNETGLSRLITTLLVSHTHTHRLIAWICWGQAPWGKGWNLKFEYSERYWMGISSLQWTVLFQPNL